MVFTEKPATPRSRALTAGMVAAQFGILYEMRERVMNPFKHDFGVTLLLLSNSSLYRKLQRSLGQQR
jgi:hypothetical protein